jgi:uncharacterized glyoxalase superfamily protein PhnB
VARLRAFYEDWGWRANEGASDDYASFTTGSVTVALYPIDRLRDEAAPDASIPQRGKWTGVTLAINFSDRDQVDVAIADAMAAGALLVENPVDREWGGYSGYVSDPEGHRWEIAWAPDFNPV